MKKTMHTKDIAIGDIVVAYHEQSANCGNDCYKKIIGGYVVGISEAIVGIKVADTVIEVNRKHGVIVEKVSNLTPQRLGQLLIDFYKLASEYVRYEVLLAELDLLKASKATKYAVLLAELDLLKVEMDLLLDDMEFIISNTAELDLLKASKATKYAVLLAELDLLKVEMDLLLDDMEFIISNTQDE